MTNQNKIVNFLKLYARIKILANFGQLKFLTNTPLDLTRFYLSRIWHWYLLEFEWLSYLCFFLYPYVARINQGGDMKKEIKVT